MRILEFANEAHARNLMPSDIIRIAAEESNGPRSSDAKELDVA
jgi:hypothetical protein